MTKNNLVTHHREFCRNQAEFLNMDAWRIMRVMGAVACACVLLENGESPSTCGNAAADPLRYAPGERGFR